MAFLTRDTWAALVIMAGAAFLIWFVIPGQTIAGFEDELQQSFMPTLGAGLMGVSALIMLLNAVLNRTQRETDDSAMAEAGTVDRVFWGVVVGAGLLLAVALFGLSRFGFIVGGFFLIASFGLVFQHRKPVQVAVLAAVMPVVLFYVVRFGLGLALP